MADQKVQQGRPAVTFQYAFRFDTGEEQVVRVELDPKTLDLIEPRRPAREPRTHFGVCPCDSCPLKATEQPACPAVASLEGLLKPFAGHRPDEEMEVSIETEARTYLKRTTLQQAVTSLIGIFMVTSGCPVLGRLKPMVRYHLPFATLEETQYRVISMYLLAQFLLARHGKRPDWKLQDLVKMYQDIQTVNEYFVNRLSTSGQQDPSINALVILQAFSYAIVFSVDRDLLDEIELLFKAYVPGATSG